MNNDNEKCIIGGLISLCNGGNNRKGVHGEDKHPEKPIAATKRNNIVTHTYLSSVSIGPERKYKCARAHTHTYKQTHCGHKISHFHR